MKHVLIIIILFSSLFIDTKGQSNQTKAKQYYITAKEALNKNNPEKCLSYLEKTTNILGATNIKVQPLKIKALYAQKDYQSVVKEVGIYKSLRPNPNLAEYQTLMEYDRISKETIKKETIEFKKAMAQEDIVPCIQFLATYPKSQYKEKLQKHMAALEHLPQQFDYVYSIAEVLYKKKDCDQAIKYYKIALQTKPNHYKANYGLGKSYYEIKQYDSAAVHLEKAVKIKPNDYNANYSLGLFYYYSKNYESALVYLKNAMGMIKDKPDYYLNFLNLVAAYYESGGDINETKGYYTYVIEHTPKQSSSYEKIISQAGNALREMEVKELNANSDFQVGTFKDSRDGQVYKKVTIGSQTWMAENLRYKTGKHVESESSWKNLKYYDEAYCWYDNDIKNLQEYGVLYTYEAAKDGCPSGWHLPSAYEWDMLEEFLKKNGYKKEIAKSLASTSGWDVETRKGAIKKGKIGNNQQLNNRTGFSALPSGSRDDGSFGYRGQGYVAYFWTSTADKDKRFAYYRELIAWESKIEKMYSGKADGNSVRCVKD